jgi:hypothetical protein
MKMERELTDPDEAQKWKNDLECKLADLYTRANDHIDDELCRRAKLAKVKIGNPTVATIGTGQLVLKKPNSHEKHVLGRVSVKYLGPYEVIKIEGDALTIRDLKTNLSEKVKSSTCRIFYDKHGVSTLAK